MKLAQDLELHGLYARGSTNLTAAEIETYEFGDEVKSVTLVGNIGSSYWPIFSQSGEYLDGRTNPLDRWSRRIAGEIVTRHPVQAIFPFTGPPYYPFLQWAQRAESLTQSPLGLMIHAEYGLWHSYRFALLMASVAADAPVPQAGDPCLSCESRPCLNTCPVDAFDGNGYAVDRCATYLKNTPQADCHSNGCLARYACPVAPGYRYTAQQNQFHLSAFLKPRV